jgi:16S rRNA (guanine527-N7)-methyltransferase
MSTDAGLDAYLTLLARWNRTINLTSLTIDPPDDAAIERLIREPTRAAALVRPDDRLAVDLGSGGGSPAIPLKLACPALRFVLVESRARKCAFLGEAVRQLGLADVEIENRRFEDLADARPDLAGVADVVTFRAVRADEPFWHIVNGLLAPSGQVLWFGGLPGAIPPWLVVTGEAGHVMALARQ